MRATKVALFIWVGFHEENETGRWVGIRAEVKNEIAALANFGNENEMRPFHLWNNAYPNLATPRLWVAGHTQKKRVWISPYTLFLFGDVSRPHMLLVGRFAPARGFSRE